MFYLFIAGCDKNCVACYGTQNCPVCKGTTAE